MEWAALGGITAILGIIIGVLNSKINTIADSVLYSDEFEQFEKRYADMLERLKRVESKIDEIHTMMLGKGGS